MLSPLSKITNAEISTQFALVKYHNSKRNNDFFLHNAIPVTLYKKMLTIRDTGEEFELQGDLLKKITNRNYKTDLVILSDKKYIV